MLVELLYNYDVNVKSFKGVDIIFKSKLFFNNIAQLIKENNAKIGELESHANVSAGYISRASKDESSKPGIDFVVSVAEFFEVSVDTLINVEFNSLTPTERYLIKFFEKLKKDTLDDRVHWIKYTPDTLNQAEPDINGFVDHPLMNYETFYDEDEEGYPVEVSRTVMNSASYGLKNVISGDCFQLQMANSTSIHIMSLCKSMYRANDSDSHCVEIWSVTKGGELQFLASSVRTNNLRYLVKDLYQTVLEDSKHPRLNESLKYAIDSYMSNGIVTGDIDYNDLPF